MTGSIGESSHADCRSTRRLRGVRATGQCTVRTCHHPIYNLDTVAIRLRTAEFVVVSTQVRSRNVFADLGFEDPSAEMAKAMFVQVPDRAIRWCERTSDEVARLGVHPAFLTGLLRGGRGGVRDEQLFSYLGRIGLSVQIRVNEQAVEGGVPVSVQVG